MTNKHDSGKVLQSRFIFTIVLNLIITFAQITGGIISGSLALISDAICNFSDSGSVILAWFVEVLVTNPAL